MCVCIFFILTAAAALHICLHLQLQPSEMRQSSPLFFLLLLLLLAFHTAATASRVLREDGEITGPEEIKYEPVDELEFFPWHNLVGTEGCTDGNEECLNRRVMYEAHLDYIYTQHRPKP